PRALELAKQVVEVLPKTADSWGVCGTTRYRNGDWKGAIADLEKAIDLRGPDAPNDFNSYNGFFLAMAYWRIGEKDKAHDWFGRAVKGMAKGNPHDDQLRRFHAEAAELLGVSKKD